MRVLLRTLCGCTRVTTVKEPYPAGIMIPLIGDGSRSRTFDYSYKKVSGMRVYVERLV